MKDREKMIAFIKALEEAKVDDRTGIIRMSKEFRDELVAELKEWAK